jgi:hypothetical protein
MWRTKKRLPTRGQYVVAFSSVCSIFSFRKRGRKIRERKKEREKKERKKDRGEKGRKREERREKPSLRVHHSSQTPEPSSEDLGYILREGW